MRLIDQRLHRVRRNAQLRFGGTDHEVVLDFHVALVHHNGSDSIISIDKRSSQQVAAAGRCTHTLCAGPDEFGKVADVIIGRRIYQLSGAGVSMNRCEAEVTYVVRASGFIQQDIPVSPANGSGVEVVDHGTAITFSIGPVLVAFS